MLLDGKALAAEMRQALKEEIAKQTSVGGRSPSLAIITIGADTASSVYVKNKKRACEEIGIIPIHAVFSESCSQEEVLQYIESLGENEAIDGIIVQLPLPEGWDEKLIINSINFFKDVDGLTATNIGLLRSGIPFFVPCTAAGIMDLLDHYDINIDGKDVVVIGRSNIVGKPVADLLMARGATVTQCHSHTTNLSAHVRQADIVISAVGKPNFLTAKDFGYYTEAVVDVGINRDENGKLCGDVAAGAVDDRCDYITPVPGGVGPMTVVELMKNTVESWKRRERF